MHCFVFQVNLAKKIILEKRIAQLVSMWCPGTCYDVRCVEVMCLTTSLPTSYKTWLRQRSY